MENERFSDKLKRFCAAHECYGCPLMQDCVSNMFARMAEDGDTVEKWAEEHEKRQEE